MKTTSAVSILALIEVIRDHGIPLSVLEKETGVNRKKMTDPDARITMTQFLRLWQMAETVSQDPAIGLNLRKKYQTRTKHFVVLLALNSRNLLEALQAWARYDMLICDSDRIDFSEKGNRYCITYTNTSPVHENRWIPEHHASLAVDYARNILGAEFAPIRLDFRHTDPGYNHEYQDVFQCPVRFNRDENRVWVRKTDLLRPITDRDPYLQAVLTKHADTAIARLTQNFSFRNRVQDYIIQHLHKGSVNATSVSQAMNMDRSTLHRHLKRDNTSFRQLLTETRKDLAVNHLKQGMSISQAGYLLGYSDPSSFQRAFKRWTGKRPGEFRHPAQQPRL